MNPINQRATPSLKKMSHAVFFPFPALSQTNLMLKLAKLLHIKGFYITFVNSDYNHQLLLNSAGDDGLKDLDDFDFVALSDGISPSIHNSPEFYVEMMISDSMQKNFAARLNEILLKLNKLQSVPPVSCIVYNFLMPFTLDVAEKLGIPAWVTWGTNAGYFMALLHLDELIQRGYIPLKDESYLTNGYLDTSIDWIPGMKGIRLKDLPSFIRTTDPRDVFLNTEMELAKSCSRASGLIFFTCDDLENEITKHLKQQFPTIYTLGPLTLLMSQVTENKMKPMHISLSRGNYDCIEWLNNQKAASVIYVSFGSIISITSQDLTELAWGLAESNFPFMWIIRPGFVEGGVEALPKEFIEETKGRCFFASWCPQEEVLSHPSIGAFVTHSGWSSMLESICSGVPMICWPRYVDGYMNCFLAREKWGVGIEMDQEVKRENVREVVSVVMEGKEGKGMRENAIRWKEKAQEGIMCGGSSYENMERLLRDMTPQSPDELKDSH